MKQDDIEHHQSPAQQAQLSQRMNYISPHNGRRMHAAAASSARAWHASKLRNHAHSAKGRSPTCALQDAEHAVQVVHGTLDCGANVDVEDGRAVLVGLQAGSQVVVVDLTAVKGVNLQGRKDAGQS